MFIDDIVMLRMWCINVSHCMVLRCYVRLLTVGGIMMRNCDVWVIVV